MPIYEMTMQALGNEDTYSEHVFEAPHDVAAVMYALRFPGRHGWSATVEFTVGRFHMVAADSNGHPTSAQCAWIFVENTMSPRWWLDSADDDDVGMRALHLINADRYDEGD